MIATYAVAVRSQHSSGRALAGPIVMSCGAAVVLVGSFQPWLSSGTVGRTSYELLGVVQRLGFVPSGVARLAIRSWPLMPLLLTAGVVAVWLGWRLAGAAVGTLGAIYAGVVGGVIAVAAPDNRAARLSNAPAATAVGAAIVIVGSLLVVILRVPSADANRQ